MNIRDLKYLVSLVEHKHFGKAAAACFVSQPALSMQIKKLENYLGVQLLERTNKSVILTEIGTILAEKAQNILSQAEEMLEIAKLANDPYCGDLKIGIIPTLAPYLIPHLIPRLSARYPKLKIFLLEEQTHIILEKLKQAQIDTAILALPIAEKNFISHILFEEEFFLAIPDNHAFAKRKSIKQKELANKNLLLLEDGHCLRDQALEICNIVDAQEYKGFRASSLETLRYMVASDIGITLIPKLACKKIAGINYIPFSTPKPSRIIGMLWRNSTTKKTLLKEIVDFIKHTLIETKILK